MSEVLVQIDEPQRAADGRIFIAQVHGARGAGGLWEAWIEFTPADGGDPVRTLRQTEQLTRGDLRYWAAGLTRDDITRALARALAPNSLAIPRGFSIPDLIITREQGEQMVLDTDRMRRPEPPVLDPVAVFARSGEHRLRHELRALDAPQLRDIIAAFDIPEMDVHDFARTFEDALAERIVASMQQRVGAATTRADVSGSARSTK